MDVLRKPSLVTPGNCSNPDATASAPQPDGSQLGPSSITIVSTSLRLISRSRTLGRQLSELLTAFGETCRFIDLREMTLPLSDGESSFSDPAVTRVQEALSVADGIVIATPIHNYDVGAVAKNFLELCGSGLREKAVGLLAAAGGPRAYMAPLGFLNSLMLDYRAQVHPSFVYAPESSFEGAIVRDSAVLKRLDEFARDFSSMVAGRRYAAKFRSEMTR